MLAQTLQWPDHDGMVNHVACDVVPPHVDDRLTSLGCEAAERVRCLAEWIEASRPRIAEGCTKRLQGSV
jgi:DNA-binding HxlR family transcriptional regulator